MAFEGKKEVNAVEFANAFQNGAKVAYKAVMRPVEGTILTVIRESSDAVVKYTLPEDNHQIFASKNFTYLPTEEELKRELRLDEFQKLDE